MLGRGVAPLAAAGPDAVFAGVRLQIASADLAVANLESPLTTRPHLAARGPERTRGAPRRRAAACRRRLRCARDREQPRRGRRPANRVRHDAGPRGGGAAGARRGECHGCAFEPRILSVHGVRVAFLSFDDTGEGPRAGAGNPGRRVVGRRTCPPGRRTGTGRGRPRRRRPPRRLGLQPDHRPVAAPPGAAARRLGRRRRLGNRPACRPADQGDQLAGRTSARSSRRASATSCSTSTSPGRAAASSSRCSRVPTAYAPSGSATTVQEPSNAVEFRQLAPALGAMPSRSAAAGGRSPAR